MFCVFFKKTRLARQDERGVVLVLFLVLILPLLLLIAVAIDLSQFLVMKRQLVNAVDAAALQIATLTDSPTDQEVMNDAQAYVQANFPAGTSIGSLGTIQVTRIDANTTQVTATATLNTSFLKIFGYNTLNVTVSSQSVRSEKKLEIVLVLDNTGSMGSYAGNQVKIDALKQASTTLINTLFGSNDTSQYVKIGLVPFTAAVNLGNASRPWWIDQQGTSPLNTENLNLPVGWPTPPPAQSSLFYIFDHLSNGSWQGCVRQRPEPYDLLDTPPDLSNPSTLFVPYLAPSEPSGFSNHYLPDTPAGLSQQSLQMDTSKYQNGAVNGGTPNLFCPAQPVQTLTDTKTNVLTAINAMTPGGNTVLPAGLMWGWHVVSPNLPFATGASYGDAATMKAIVLVTDGQNSVSSGCCSYNHSLFSAYGYAGAGGHLGTNLAGGGPERVLDQKFATLCENIKSDLGNGSNRIVIYTIALGADVDPTGAALLRNCATDSAHYFDSPTSADLQNAFQSIALGLNKLRVSQ